MTPVTKFIEIARPASEVWAFVADPEAPARYGGLVTAVEVEGDLRRCETPMGTLTERMLARDDGAMRFEYALIGGPFALTSHHATWTVERVGDGARVTWTTDVEPAEAAAGVGMTTEAGLAALKQHLEQRG